MRYVIDPERSQLDVRGRSSVHPIEMRSRALSGSVEIADGRLRSAELTVPSRSLSSGQLLQDRELRRQIQVRKHPDIRASVSTPASVADGAAEVAGEITFLGTTRPASGPLQLTVGDGEVHIQGSSTFDVRDFGLKPPRVLGLRVEAEVTVSVDLRFVPESNPA